MTTKTATIELTATDILGDAASADRRREREVAYIGSTLRAMAAGTATDDDEQAVRILGAKHEINVDLDARDASTLRNCYRRLTDDPAAMLTLLQERQAAAVSARDAAEVTLRQCRIDLATANHGVHSHNESLAEVARLRQQKPYLFAAE